MSYDVGQMKSELTEILALARELNAALVDTKAKSEATHQQLQSAISDTQALLALTQKLNLPDDVKDQVATLQRLLSVILMVKVAYSSIGIGAIITGITAVFSLTDALGSFV